MIYLGFLFDLKVLPENMAVQMNHRPHKVEFSGTTYFFQPLEFSETTYLANPRCAAIGLGEKVSFNQGSDPVKLFFSCAGNVLGIYDGSMNLT